MFRVQLGTRHLLSLASLVAIAAISSGCESTNTKSNTLLGDDILSQASENGAQESPTTAPQQVIVQFRQDSKLTKPQRLKWNQTMTVQDVVEQTRADSRFRNMTVYIEREAPATGKKVQLKSEFDTGARKIPFEDDFHIHPNDRIVIQQAETNALDAVIHSVVGGLDSIVPR